MLQTLRRPAKMTKMIATVLICCALFGASRSSDLLLVSRLDELLQLRLSHPIPGSMGMSRLTVPSSMGAQFQPDRSRDVDFFAENTRERDVIRELEKNDVHVGFYVFGTSIVITASQAMDYRTLKGPAAVTRGTPRPAWYPHQTTAAAAQSGSLPDWKAIYPLARRAMQDFQNGRPSFAGSLEGWEIVARPVASGDQCAMCHARNRPIGGVLYAFRRAGR